MSNANNEKQDEKYAFFVEMEQVSADGISIEKIDPTLITEAVEEIGGKFKTVLQKICPTKASVEFGLTFKADTEGVTKIIFKGGAEATITITLEWTKDTE
jgi:hypothetical protein